MARIREYTQQTSVGGEVGGRRASSEDFGFGREMQNFGETMVSVGAYVKEQDDRREVDAAQEAMSQARLMQMDAYNQKKQSHQPGDMTLAVNVRTEMSDYFDEMASQYKSKAAKHYVKTHGSQMVAGFFGDAMSYQAQKGAEYSKNMWKARQENDGAFTFANPGGYEITKQNGHNDIDAGTGNLAWLKKEDRELLKHEYTQFIAWNTAMGAIENPMTRAAMRGVLDSGLSQQAKEAKAAGMPVKEGLSYLGNAGASVEIDGKTLEKLPDFIKDLAPDKRVRVVQMMDQYQKQEDSVADKARTSRATNQIVYMSETGQVPRDLMKPGELPNHPDLAAKLLAVADNTTLINQAVEMPRDQAITMIEARNPAKGMTPEQVTEAMNDPGFDSKLKVYNIFKDQYEQRRKLYEKDFIAVDQSGKFAPGTGGMNKITAEDPSKWIEELRVRQPIVNARAQQIGVRYRTISDQEAAVMGEVLAKQSPADQLKTMALLGNNFKQDPQFASTLMNQMAKGNYGLAFVGNLKTLTDTGQKWEGQTLDQVGTYVLLGEKVRAQYASGDKDAKGFGTLQLPNKKDIIKAFESLSEYKNVSPEFTNRLPAMLDVVESHLVGKIASAGGSKFDAGSSDIQSSIKSIIGDPSKVGAWKVIRPWGMKDSDFRDAVEQRVSGSYGQTYSLRNVIDKSGAVYEVTDMAGNPTGKFIDLMTPASRSERQSPSKTSAASTVVKRGQWVNPLSSGGGDWSQMQDWKPSRITGEAK